MSKYIHHFIFKVKENKIAVYQKRDNPKFLCIPRNEEEFREFDSSFWKQWEKEFSFIPQNHLIDFAFISDRKCEMSEFGIPETFLYADETVWNMSVISAFMEEHVVDYSSVALMENGHRIWGCGNTQCYLCRPAEFSYQAPAEPASIVEVLLGDVPAEIIDTIKRQ